MTNFEKYKDEIARMALEAGAVAVMNEKPRLCANTSCQECDLKTGMTISCKRLAKEWAEAEYEEPLLLNEYELKFCEMIETGYIVKDEEKGLFWFKDKPIKTGRHWGNPTGGAVYRLNGNGALNHLFKEQLEFDFITWKSGKVWSVEEILRGAKHED